MLKPAAVPGRPRFRRIRDNKYLLLLFAPCLAYYLLFHYLPMFGIAIAFQNFSVYKGVWESNWVGLRYFRMFLDSPDFWPLLRNTFLLGLYKLVFGFPAPIILALMLNEVRLKVMKRFVQTVSYLPHFISNVVVAGMVLLFLSPTNGIINDWIQALGLEPVSFMNRPEWFRTVYVASEIWQHTGWEAIIYLAALAAVDPHLYEAADMDGAGRWRKMWHITLPGIAPAIFILGILNIGNVLEIGFEKVYLLYSPATYSTADIIQTYVYRLGIVNGSYSYASAIGIFLSVVSFCFLFMANWLARKTGNASLW